MHILNSLSKSMLRNVLETGLGTMLQAPSTIHEIPIQSELRDSNPHKVFISGLNAARDAAVHAELNIYAILTIGSENILKSYEAFDDPRRYKIIKVFDMPSSKLERHFEDIYIFISDAIQHGNVLVHCSFGVSRSATAVIAYLIKKYRITREKALEIVRKGRNVCCPNSGFMTQLTRWESYCLGSID
jgi:dual specificity phosphatase 12